MEENCSRRNDCESFKQTEECSGCGYKYFDKILNANRDNKTLEFLAEEFFSLCSKTDRKVGGRQRLDEPIKKLFFKKFPQLKELHNDALKVKLPLKNDKENLEIKCDGAFEINGLYIFYEVKGAGDNTNDVLSAITAAQLIKKITKYQNHIYYYIGVTSGIKANKNGLNRDHFFDRKRTKIYPYVKWAEEEGFLKFYGIVDIEVLLTEIEDRIKNHTRLC